jgi:hypothetical protein
MMGLVVVQASSVDTNPVHYRPVLSTIVAVAFTIKLYERWKQNPSARYLMWWTIGIAMYGVGTLMESLTTIFGWSEPVSSEPGTSQATA